MKDGLKYLFGALIMLPVVIFAIGFLFDDSFSKYREVLEVANSTEDANVNIELRDDIFNGSVPVLNYTEGSQEVGNSFIFKSVFQVTTETGIKNGTVEDDFAIYLSDIRSAGDVSVVEFLSKEQIDELEEIPAAFLYDEENDMLYCHKSGVYNVIVKVYGSNGTQAEYQFVLPVEAEG